MTTLARFFTFNNKYIKINFYYICGNYIKYIFCHKSFFGSINFILLNLLFLIIYNFLLFLYNKYRGTIKKTSIFIRLGKIYKLWNLFTEVLKTGLWKKSCTQCSVINNNLYDDFFILNLSWWRFCYLVSKLSTKQDVKRQTHLMTKKKMSKNRCVT